MILELLAKPLIWMVILATASAAAYIAHEDKPWMQRAMGRIAKLFKLEVEK